MFDDVRDLYNQTILTRGRAPKHMHRLATFDATAKGDNPMCGDRVEVWLKYAEGGAIAETGYLARGCEISVVSADLMVEAVQGQTPADTKALSASVAALNSQLSTLSATVTALKGDGIAREREQLLTLAAHEGKVIPASALPDKDGKGGLDNIALKALCAELPVTVPVDRRTPATGPLHTLSASPLGAGGDEKIRQSMGISKERWDKKD